ncbi:MurR/RpiR family transcriptional regulator [Propionibacterium sp.]|uniref:MurR/RpiR family transcriptional regulator n=1 Tax=Propionibacterium sp. TaxID=1977903 RepID=UPI0039EC4695
MSPIEARIAAVYPELTAQERRGTDTLLEHLDDLAIYSSAELSKLSGVSRPTLSRLYKRLGYESFAALRSEARRDRGIPLGPNHGVEAHIAQETRNIAQLARLADGRLQAAVRSIVSANDLFIIGERSSYPVALHLRQQLIQLRPKVHVLPLPGQTLGEDLVSIGPGDTVVLIGLRRRTSGFARLLRQCTHSRAETVLIADNTGRRYEPEVTHFLPCSLDASGPFNSYTAAMSLVAMVANEASTVVGVQGQRRVGLITTSYHDLNEIEGS